MALNTNLTTLQSQLRFVMSQDTAPNSAMDVAVNTYYQQLTNTTSNATSP